MHLQAHEKIARSHFINTTGSTALDLHSVDAGNRTFAAMSIANAHALRRLHNFLQRLAESLAPVAGPGRCLHSIQPVLSDTTGDMYSFGVRHAIGTPTTLHTLCAVENLVCSI
jgi:hypothetical protein